MIRIAGIAPVDGEADLPHLLAVDLHRAQALGDHRDPLDRPTRGRDLDLRTVRDPLLLSEAFRNLDEEAGLQLVQHSVVLVLGPVMEVLGQAVGRADDREVLLLSIDVLVRRELLADRVGGHLRVERVIDRRLDRLVVLGEGTVVHARGIQTSDTFRKHDECP